MKNISVITAIALAALASVAIFSNFKKKKVLPIVAIANYGPLKDLEVSIQGIKDELANNGFIENETVKIEIADIAFDHSLIPQTVMKLKNYNPKIMVVVSTPIAQFAKGKICDVPLVFHAITDPVASGLLKYKNRPSNNITGSSDVQNLDVLLRFVKTVLPNARTLGMLVLTSDSNDTALLEMMKKAAPVFDLSIVVIPVDQVRDIPICIQKFKGKVDFIYVGASGLHAAMPTIASEAGKMNIPVFDSEDQSVRNGLALASFGVNYESVGRNAGKLVAKLLKGTSVKDLAPIYPQIEDHKCFINRKLARRYKIIIPENATIVE
ncbi:MAG: ABC transporter substrate-binding protein [Holosporales bacterium]|jgi:putative ABC transport system substrate-binding protein|nr:ABC transporter substrate-binding protein [Holosporales bacterium]